MDKVNTRGFRITKEQLIFLAASGRPIDPQTFQILERVLVNGESQPSVAKDYGVTQQSVSKSVKSIYRRLANQFKDVPNDFVIRTVAIHESLLDELEALQIKSYKLIGR